MTATLSSPPTSEPPTRSHSRRRLVAAAAGLALAAGAGIGIGVAVTGSGGPSSAATGTSGYAYYQQVMGRYGGVSGGMMGGNYGWMMGRSGYGWMMGGASAPGWMSGGALPGYMMGSNKDMGEVMGRLFADAPGARVKASDADSLATSVPTGATVDRAANSVTFAGSSVSYTVVASPAGADDQFETAGLIDPTIAVPAGARVTVQFVNADTTSAHGYVVTPSGSSTSWMPMATVSPAFAGATIWFLGDAGPAGAHTATVTFVADEAGSYQYICPVPGHAQKGMKGLFVVATKS